LEEPFFYIGHAPKINQTEEVTLRVQRMGNHPVMALRVDQ
jgi:hypothetical protein